MRPALRLLATPRWIGLTALAGLALAVCFVASVWQYQRTNETLDLARAAVAEPVPYAEAVPGDGVPLEAYGRQVEVVGVLVPGARSFVRDRLSVDDRVGVLVVDGVRLADGRTVAVLQGWVPSPQDAPPVRGRIDVLGRVQTDENFYASAPVTQDAPLVTITRRGLAEQWSAADAGAGAALVPGYVTAVSPAAGFERTAPVLGSDPDIPFPLQNAFYSLQWLIFAGFVVFVWVKVFRSELAAGGDRPAVAETGDRVSLDR